MRVLNAMILQLLSIFANFFQAVSFHEFNDYVCPDNTHSFNGPKLHADPASAPHILLCDG